MVCLILLIFFENLTSQITVVEIILFWFGITYILLEIYLNINCIRGDTSNILLLEWTRNKKLIFIPFAIGAIGGHLFLGSNSDIFQFCNNFLPVIILFLVCLLLLLIGLFIFSKTKKISRSLITFLLCSGMAYGHWVWSMNFTGNKCYESIKEECRCFTISGCKNDCVYE
jgi:hypothetical protein